MPKNNRIYFEMPEDVSMVDFIYEILEKNGIQEDEDAWIEGDQESRVVIVRDAALAILQKKIPEQKLINLLAKHLQTSEEAAEKVVQDIKEKLIPYAKITSAETPEPEDQKEKYRQNLLKKINANRSVPIKNEEEPPAPYYKKLEITNVEKNAENMKKEGKNIMTEEKSKFTKRTEEDQEPQYNAAPDTYREPIE